MSLPNELDPNAPVATPAAQATEASPPAPAPSPVELRFNEITAKFEAEKRDWAAQIEEQRRTTAELIRVLGEQKAAPAAPAAPPPDIDPDDFRRIQYVTRQTVSPELAQQQQLLQQTQAMLAEMRWQQAVQAEPDQEVVKTAQTLLADWRRRGLTGFVETDALNYARGVVVQRQRETQAGERRFGGPPSNTVVTQSAPPPPVNTAAPGQYKLPANIDDLPLEKQLELYEKAGLGDLPL